MLSFTFRQTKQTNKTVVETTIKEPKPTCFNSQSNLSCNNLVIANSVIAAYDQGALRIQLEYLADNVLQLGMSNVF